MLTYFNANIFFGALCKKTHPTAGYAAICHGGPTFIPVGFSLKVTCPAPLAGTAPRGHFGESPRGGQSAQSGLRPQVRLAGWCRPRGSRPGEALAWACRSPASCGLDPYQRRLRRPAGSDSFSDRSPGVISGRPGIAFPAARYRGYDLRYRAHPCVPRTLGPACRTSSPSNGSAAQRVAQQRIPLDRREDQDPDRVEQHSKDRLAKSHHACNSWIVATRHRGHRG